MPGRAELPKSPSGISGFDEITFGGLPTGRPTLVCGGAGCGKTLFALEFLLRGAEQYGDPGVFIAFEETADDLAQNCRSLGFDLDRLIAEKKIVVDYIHIERGEIEETGEYDLEGLFLRLDLAVNEVKAKRVVLDTIEALFSGFANPVLLRAEIRRLFRFLKQRGLTSVITGERGEGTLTRQGLEEYVSDCVISLDHRVREQISTRHLRIVKYRGSSHGTNEYPFLIDADGISVLPLTSLLLNHQARDERVSSGIPKLDAMLDGRGFYRGSTVLVMGGAGTGKSSVAAHFVHAACERGERALLLAFEESPSQIVRNMKSIGIDLSDAVKKEMLRIEATRPTLHGLEMHLVKIHKIVNAFDPHVIVVDPITTFFTGVTQADADAMILRLVDFLKARGITAMFTHPIDRDRIGPNEIGIASLIDTWILLRGFDGDGDRRRRLSVLKSRGMAHATAARTFTIDRRGVKIDAAPGTTPRARTMTKKKKRR